MRISEDRLQILLPRRLKRALEAAARESGISVGEYLRRTISRELRRGPGPVEFPFGESPIRTGRRRGSIEHDRLR
jgi:hypothetical protein